MNEVAGTDRRAIIQKYSQPQQSTQLTRQGQQRTPGPPTKWLTRHGVRGLSQRAGLHSPPAESPRLKEHVRLHAADASSCARARSCMARKGGMKQH
eukprot:6194188-Pleurochrysis_carterae.AAC.10